MADLDDRPTVRTSAGAVRGRREDGLDVFRGIPFAEPPVGDLRFAAPRPAARWAGVRDAFEFGPPPPQDVGSFRDRLPPDWDPVAGERSRPGDWLTVNVWTPSAGAASARPVIVWIYGGAYKVGSADSPGYDAQRIARDGDVVVVTFNHRVGIEGFAVIDGAPANRGLLDQVAALEWVRDNIAAFGGDPDRVTVAASRPGPAALPPCWRWRGPTACSGARSWRACPARSCPVSLAPQWARPSRPSAVWAVPWPSWRRFPRTNWSWPGSRWPPGSTSSRRQWGQLASHDTLFAPVVDGDVLPTTPWEALSSGSARGVDLVVGHTRDECRLFLVMRGRAGRITESDAARALAVFGPGQDGEKYRAAFPEASAEQLYGQVQTDTIFRMPALPLAEAQTAGGGRAYLYELAWEVPGAGGLLGACHGLDLPLLFGTFGDSLGPLLFGPSPRRRRTPPLPSSAGRGRRSPRPATRAGPGMTRSTA